MAGKQCGGLADSGGRPFVPKLKETKAYCDGYKARTLSTTPTNPYTTGTPEALAWARGVAAKAGEASADADKGCCAPCGAAATP